MEDTNNDENSDKNIFNEFSESDSEFEITSNARNKESLVKTKIKVYNKIITLQLQQK